MEYKREELIALMREMEKQIALCHIRPRLAGAIADELERSEPVVRGRWEPVLEGVWNLPMPACVGWRCSMCGREEQDKEPYCHCGARMDGE